MILFIDKDKNLCEVMTEYLRNFKQCDFQVFIDSPRLFKEPNVVIINSHFPDFDKIITGFPHSKIVVMTTNWDISAYENYFVLKMPFELSDLDFILGI